jgi:hypothetical protein
MKPPIVAVRNHDLNVTFVLFCAHLAQVVLVGN